MLCMPSPPYLWFNVYAKLAHLSFPDVTVNVMYGQPEIVSMAFVYIFLRLLIDFGTKTDFYMHNNVPETCNGRTQALFQSRWFASKAQPSQNMVHSLRARLHLFGANSPSSEMTTVGERGAAHEQRNATGNTSIKNFAFSLSQTNMESHLI